MVDLWGTSNSDIRERWRGFARIMQDARDGDHLAELLQLVGFGMAVAGSCGRGTGGEVMLRNLLPTKTAELLLHPEPGLRPPPPIPDEATLRANLRPEFPPTRARLAREKRSREERERGLKATHVSPKSSLPTGGELAELHVLESTSVLEAFRTIRAQTAALDARVHELEARPRENPTRRGAVRKTTGS